MCLLLLWTIIMFFPPNSFCADVIIRGKADTDDTTLVRDWMKSVSQSKQVDIFIIFYGFVWCDGNCFWWNVLSHCFINFWGMHCRLSKTVANWGFYYIVCTEVKTDQIISSLYHIACIAVLNFWKMLTHEDGLLTRFFCSNHGWRLHC